MAKIALTASRVLGFRCPSDKVQAFLWDSNTRGLGLRATPSGQPTYVFQAVYQGRDLRITIGRPQAWSIPQAQEKARELQRQIDEGRDPRAVKAEKTATDVARRNVERQAGATVREVWDTYLTQRKPHWGGRHYQDHVNLAQAGGQERQRWQGMTTTAGPLAHFMPLRLTDITPQAVQAWVERETKTRPARTRLALRVLKAFLRWCADEPQHKATTDPTAASTKKTREAAGTAKVKNDYLQREQLATWFNHVQRISNPVISAYLQCLLLTGARREELAELKWTDVNFQWRGLTLKDKIEDFRAVPLTPYVANLLACLPKRTMSDRNSGKAIANPWVFSSPSSASGRLREPSIAHRNACVAAGLSVTLHGLRRSFASLCEWLDIPGGISAQIQGHAPQGVREQNYIRRPLDLLRLHHEKIEAWMLQQAGIDFDAGAAPGSLRLVKPV